MKRSHNRGITFKDVVCPICLKEVFWMAQYGEYYYSMCCGNLVSYNILKELYAYTRNGTIVEIPKSKLRNWRDEND